MTAGYNTYANISSLVNTIYEDSLLVARDAALGPSIVTTFTDMSGMALRKVNEYGTVTVNSVGESDDLVSQVFTPANLSTLTPAEYAAQFLLTDQRIETDWNNVNRDAAMELGAGFAESVDTNLFSNFTSLTGGTVGASGSSMTWAYFNAAVARLRNGKVPMAGLVAVMHPYHWNDLAAAASTAATSETNAPEWLRAELARNYFVGRVSGVNIFLSPYVGTNSTDAYFAVFHPMALALDVRRAFRIERERDASRRAWELNASTVYAHGVWRPKWGIQGIADATAP